MFKYLTMTKWIVLILINDESKTISTIIKIGTEICFFFLNMNLSITF